MATEAVLVPSEMVTVVVPVVPKPVEVTVNAPLVDDDVIVAVDGSAVVAV